MPPPADAERELAASPGALAAHRRRAVLGTGQEVREELERIAIEYGAREVVVVTITHDHAMRRRSYELLADAFELVPRSASA